MWGNWLKQRIPVPGSQSRDSEEHGDLSCGCVEVHPRFARTYCFHLQDLRVT
jgi:hypothetical protein